MWNHPKEDGKNGHIKTFKIIERQIYVRDILFHIYHFSTYGPLIYNIFSVLITHLQYTKSACFLQQSRNRSISSRMTLSWFSCRRLSSWESRPRADGTFWSLDYVSNSRSLFSDSHSTKQTRTGKISGNLVIYQLIGFQGAPMVRHSPFQQRNNKKHEAADKFLDFLSYRQSW